MTAESQDEPGESEEPQIGRPHHPLLRRPVFWWWLGVVFLGLGLFPITVGYYTDDPLFLILGVVISLPKFVLLAVTLGVGCWVVSLVMLIRAPVKKRQHWVAKASHIIAGFLAVPVLLYSGLVFWVAGLDVWMDSYQVLFFRSPDGCQIVVKTVDWWAWDGVHTHDNYYYLEVPGSITLQRIDYLVWDYSADGISVSKPVVLWDGASGVLRVGGANATVYCPA